MGARLNMPAADIKPIVESFLDEILSVLGEGRRIEIRGFGAFSVKHHKARKGRNPRTGLPIELTEHDTPGFKFSADAQAVFEGHRKDRKAAKAIPPRLTSIFSAP